MRSGGRHSSGSGTPSTTSHKIPSHFCATAATSNAFKKVCSPWPWNHFSLQKKGPLGKYSVRPWSSPFPDLGWSGNLQQFFIAPRAENRREPHLESLQASLNQLISIIKTAAKSLKCTSLLHDNTNLTCTNFWKPSCDFGIKSLCNFISQISKCRRRLI